jgi:hypothetical protein
MELDKLIESVQYVTDSQGKRRAVLVELATWETLVRYLEHGKGEEVVNDERRAAMASEEAAYQAMHAELRAKYPDQHVAILGGKLVDHDEDGVALYLRIRQRYPGQFVLMTPVGPEPEEQYQVMSPRIHFEGPGRVQ